MSGHSKWSTIKRQKGTTDQKRAQVFTKLGGAITIAVRQGGGVGDPESNFKLRLAIDKARAVNMPKDTIERAIEKGMGRGVGSDFFETQYEGFGPGGIVIMVEAATNNKQRTTQEVKNIIEKNGGVMGNPGAVSYQFEQKGVIVVDKNGKSFDDICMHAIDAGADDIEEEGEEVFIYTKSGDLKKVKDDLSLKNFSIKEADLIKKPLTLVTIEDHDTAEKVISFMEKLESHEDVQKVYSNFEISTP